MCFYTKKRATYCEQDSINHNYSTVAVDTREINNRKIHLSGGTNIVDFETTNKELKPLERTTFLRKKTKLYSYGMFLKNTLYLFKKIENTRFGVFDLETFTDEVYSNKKTSVYASGLYIEDKLAEIFYVDKDYNFYKVVIDMLDVMFNKKYSHYA